MRVKKVTKISHPVETSHQRFQRDWEARQNPCHLTASMEKERNEWNYPNTWFWNELIQKIESDTIKRARV